MRQKKHGAKTAKCPNCGQRTIVDATLSCQWCGYPLVSARFKETKEPKAPKERPVQVKAPFLFSFVGRLVIAVLFVLLLGGAFYSLLMANALDGMLSDSDIYWQIKATVDPPKPVVVSESAYVSGLGDDYTVVVRGVVRNDGGTGRVVVHARLNIPEQSVMRSTAIHMRSGETISVDFLFPEVTTPRFRIILRTLFGESRRAYKELVHPDIDYEVWVERAP